MSHAPIDFSQARFKHLNWKFRIRNFLDGKESLTTEQAVSHMHCDLGRWYYSQGKNKYGNLKEMQEFEREHEKLHSLVKEIVSLKGNLDFAKSEGKYTELLTTSDIIVRLLTEAENSINKGADQSQKKILVGV